MILKCGLTVSYVTLFLKNCVVTICVFVYQHRHQFVENNLILKMGPVDKRKVCVCV